jgi:hypothetical protein
VRWAHRWARHVRTAHRHKEIDELGNRTRGEFFTIAKAEKKAEPDGRLQTEMVTSRVHATRRKTFWYPAKGSSCYRPWRQLWT